MTSPLAVTIVRPKRSPSEHLGMFLGTIGGVFLAAYLVMLLLPHTPLEIAPGYFETVALVAVVRLLLGSTSEFLIWSREAK